MASRLKGGQLHHLSVEHLPSLCPYQLSFRSTARAVASSNRWVWKTQFPLSPSLQLRPSWLWSCSSGNWWELWGSPDWSTPARPRTTTRPRPADLFQGTQRPSKVIENVTWQIFSLLKLLCKVGGCLDGGQLLTTLWAESKAMLTLLLLHCPERLHHSQMNETILIEVCFWLGHKN